MKDKFSNQIDSLMTSLTGDKIYLNDQNDIYNRKSSIFTFMYIDNQNQRSMHNTLNILYNVFGNIFDRRKNGSAC